MVFPYKIRQISDNWVYEIKAKPVSIKVDTKGCVPVKIDHRTTVFAKPGTDIDKLRAKYERHNKERYENLNLRHDNDVD